MEARGLSILWPLRALQLQVSGAGVNHDPKNYASFVRDLPRVRRLAKVSARSKVPRRSPDSFRAFSARTQRVPKSLRRPGFSPTRAWRSS
jgi:hypothetical protein